MYRINQKRLQYDIIKYNIKKLKAETKKSNKNVIERLTTEMNNKEKWLVDISTITEFQIG